MEARQWVTRARHPLMQGISFGSEIFDDWLKAASIEHEHLLARLLERLIDALGPAKRVRVSAGSGRSAGGARRVPRAELRSADATPRPAGPQRRRRGCLHALRGGVASGVRHPARPAHRAGVPASDGRPEATVAQPVERPSVRFAEGGFGPVAYTTLGAGEQTLVISPGSSVTSRSRWSIPSFAPASRRWRIASRSILFDRRGVGLSERLGATSTPAAVAADIAAILEHAGVPRAWLFGSSEGGLGAMRLAVDHPDRVQGLCLFGSLARGSAAPDYPWALPASAYDIWLRRLIAEWGGPVGIETFAPSAKDDPALRAWWARLVRHAASPGALKTILGGLRDADMRAELGRIGVPTLVMHRRGDRAVRFEAGRHLAQNIPGAVWHPLEGVDHFWWCGDSDCRHPGDPEVRRAMTSSSVRGPSGGQRMWTTARVRLPSRGCHSPPEH